MPNLTDVLNGEDESTIYENALEVCIGNSGTTTLPVLTWLNFTSSIADESGFKWTVPNGEWLSTAYHGTGYKFSFDGTVRFEVYENAGVLSNRNTGVWWNNSQVLVSNPDVTGADAVTNIMSLTQAEYDAIVSPDSATLYVITG